MSTDSLRFLDSEELRHAMPIDPLVVLDKPRSARQYVAYMLDRTNSMFEYHNLPTTIPAYMLELYLQIFGYAAFVKVDDTLPIQIPRLVPTKPGIYAFYGAPGGERDIYYRPRLFTIANPRLKQSIQATILYEPDETAETPCVLGRNDTNCNGLLPLFNRYAAQLVENDISIRSAQINFRALTGITVSSQRDAESARKYLDALEAGKLAILGETKFLDGVSTSNMSVQSSNTIIQLIELQQYLKASWYNELGLNVNFNMKREYMSEEEIAVNTDILLPLVDDMLKCREKMCEMINAVFGLDVSVEKSSAWANKEQEELSALATGANEGGITLKDNIADKIEDGGSDDAQHEAVQADVQPEVQGGKGMEEKGGEGGEVEDEENEENLGGEQADVTVEIKVDVETEGGEPDADNPESEAPEKSEEPDGE